VNILSGRVEREIERDEREGFEMRAMAHEH
jgi:hypothetical protein